MHALSSHNPLQTINVLHRTPEGIPTGLVHTHLVTGSGVQLVLINDKLHHFSMAVPSCPVDHGVAIIVSAMQQGLHFRGEVADDIDMATRCSKVQGIGPILQKGKHNKRTQKLDVRCEIKWQHSTCTKGKAN